MAHPTDDRFFRSFLTTRAVTLQNHSQRHLIQQDQRRSDKLILVKLIEEQRWTEVKCRLAVFPNEASRTILVSLSSCTLPTVCYPLHLACYYQAPLSVIIAFIHYNRDASFQKDTTYGQLPLHYACRNGCALDVIRVLIAINPSSIRSTTEDGSLPLHMACKYSGEEHTHGAFNQPTQTIQYLVNQYPDSLKIKDKQNRLPSDKEIAKNTKTKNTILTLSLLLNAKKRQFSGEVDRIAEAVSQLKVVKNLKFEQSQSKATKRSESKVCVVCMENDVNTVSIPCGHTSLCSGCAQESTLSMLNHSCPECRATIKSTQRIYCRVVQDD